MRFLRYVVFAGAAACAAAPAAAQQPTPGAADSAQLFVFLDCNAPYCSFDHIRREVPWVNWVRDRRDADVHLLVTGQRTGGGGWDFELVFLGLGRFAERSDTLGYVSDPDDVDIEVRDGLARTTGLGLVRYAAQTAVAPNLTVAFDAESSESAAVQAPESDPWNLWVFRIGFNGSIEGEADQRGYALRGNVSANRTSDAFKLNINVSGRRSVAEFDLDDSTTVESISENYNARVLGVWSLGPRTSLGFTGRAERSTFSNVEYGASGGPAFEFNIYPYTESTRRSLTLRYSVQAAFFDYERVTVTGRTRETRARHQLELSANIQQPWGQLFGSIEGTQYFHDLGVHRIDTFGVLEFRLLRGLSFNLFGSVSRIKDQFFLAAEGLTQDEILLQRRARETSFRFDLSAGFSYRFGSKFANVVNPRLGGGGGRFFF
jgi:hypothetical protein